MILELKLDNASDPYLHPTEMYKMVDVRSLVSSAAVQLSPVPSSNLSDLRPGAVVICPLLRHSLSSCSPKPFSHSSPSAHSGSTFRPLPFLPSYTSEILTFPGNPSPSSPSRALLPVIDSGTIPPSPLAAVMSPPSPAPGPVMAPIPPDPSPRQISGWPPPLHHPLPSPPSRMLLVIPRTMTPKTQFQHLGDIVTLREDQDYTRGDHFQKTCGNPGVRIPFPPFLSPNGSPCPKTRPRIPFPLPSSASRGQLLPLCEERYGNAPFGGESSTGWRVDPVREGVQTALVVFFIFAPIFTAYCTPLTRAIYEVPDN